MVYIVEVKTWKILYTKSRAGNVRIKQWPTTASMLNMGVSRTWERIVHYSLMGKASLFLYIMQRAIFCMHGKADL